MIRNTAERVNLNKCFVVGESEYPMRTALYFLWKFSPEMEAMDIHKAAASSTSSKSEDAADHNAKEGEN